MRSARVGISQKKKKCEDHLDAFEIVTNASSSQGLNGIQRLAVLLILFCYLFVSGLWETVITLTS